MAIADNQISLSGSRSLRTAPIPHYAWDGDRVNLAITLAFSLLIVIPLVGWVFKIQFQDPNENRTLAQPPIACWECLPNFPSAFDAYLNDHIGFRLPMIRVNAGVVYGLLGSSSDSVVVGKAPAAGEPHWLFHAGVIEGDVLGAGSLTPMQLWNWGNTLAHRRDWLQRRGIQYLFVIAPEKSAIYPELLPNYLTHRAIPPTKTDQLLRYMKETHSDIQILDLRPALLRAKATGDTYFPGDTHWNGRGMFAGYQEIFKWLRLPANSKPRELGKDYTIRLESRFANGDLLGVMGLPLDYRHSMLAVPNAYPTALMGPALWPGGTGRSTDPLKWTHLVVNLGQKGRMLVFHDSFFRMGMFYPDLFPLAEHFEWAYFAALPPTTEQLERFVNLEKPDIVIEERVARSLANVPDDSSADFESPGLPRLETPPAGNIDLINGQSFKQGFQATADSGLDFEGWAIDQKAQSLAGAVELTLDDTLYHVVYGGERPDIVATYHCPQCLNSAFKLHIPGPIPTGSHSLKLRVVSANGNAYGEVPFGYFTVK